MKPQQDRWDTLTIVLQYDRIEKRVFTPFERIRIHKERASIIKDKNFEQSEILEEKIKNTIILIETKEWQPKKFNG